MSAFSRAGSARRQVSSWLGDFEEMAGPNLWKRLSFLLLGLLFLGAGRSMAALEPTSIQGAPAFDLPRLGQALGMEVSWVETGESLRLASQWTRLEFRRDERFYLHNGVRVFLGRAITGARGSLWITQLDYERTLQPLLMPQVFSAQAPGPLRRIMVDPGHGGKDPGTINRGLQLWEKRLVLDLSARVERLLREAGYAVAKTRRDDRYLGLSQRAEMAREAGADLFLSLHFNAAGNASVEGVETYAFTPRHQPSTARARLHASDEEVYAGNQQDVWNVLLGYLVQQELVQLPRAKDRGLKRARWDVLKGLHCPGILIEGGFVSHPREGRDIGSAAYRQKLAEAIVAGVRAYDARLRSLSAS